MRNNKLLILLGLLLVSALLVVGCSQGEPAATEDPKQTEEPKPNDDSKPADEPLQLANATYVGSEKCSTCHSDQFKNWEGTKHSTMLREVTSIDQLNGNFELEGNPLGYEDVKTLGLTKEDIKWIIGGSGAEQGIWKERYVVETEEGMKILPAEWIFATQSWVDYHGADWQERIYQDACISCHTTGYSAETKKFVEPGVSCESCHGPASNHLETMSADDIVNPSNLDAKSATDVCAQCHTRGTNADGVREDALGYIPGQNNLDDFYDHIAPAFVEDEKNFWPDGASKSHHQQINDYNQSKHYESGITCFSCHDAHGGTDQPAQLIKPVDELCTSCHSDMETPVDLDKYMPKRAKNGVKYDIRSHTFKLDQPTPK